jgi:hypothetical protein
VIIPGADGLAVVGGVGSWVTCGGDTTIVSGC